MTKAEERIRISSGIKKLPKTRSKGSYTFDFKKGIFKRNSQSSWLLKK